MSETIDWKEKYRDSLREMEAEEKRWRQVEQLLRRLIGRLCAAGMGADAQLDEELTELAAANRRNAEAPELERLADSLTTVVKAIDMASMPPQPWVPSPPAPPVAARAAVLRLLEHLKADAPDAPTIHSLLAEAPGAASDAALASIIARAAELIHERGESLARERLQAAAVLSEVTKRLEEMASYLTESNTASRSHFDDTQSLNDTVISQFRELTVELSGARELGLLQTVVSARLKSVARQVCEFRDREENRLMEFNGRAEKMRARIAALEREAQDLHSKLDKEKHGARRDPLTGVSNRKSFDERFALEIGRCGRGGSSLVMLLWDIDSFKNVNDRYGHRAGDRVLQSVAGCFSAVLRPTDFVARIGGEEFAVLLVGLGLAEAVEIANQVRMAVEGLRFHFRGTPVRVTVSCGVTQLNEGDTPETVFDRADAALYKAKDGGKNLCVAA